ncbi:DUF3825 domain-containing protein [Pseudomonas brassicacearum]|jgi:hypothetical protein|uniref:DUF3825 domain-containing protein n=1 Tax=Pseudomonas brassicacearum TaxID=930166 RepID=UPI001D8C7F8A|nr:DUF3825 domain-containing protein [Pseudomonas brassicacearum]CAH0175109.1 hypothetical protein SRABI06_01301 [Pseudomonas brassicacearum]
MPKNAPYDFPEHFRDFVFMPKFDENIEELASIVEKEDWEHRSTASSASHPVLRNYLTYTYRRVAEEKKVAITPDEEYACFNLGLITERQEPVFILFQKNKLPTRDSYWHFWKFCRKGEWDLNRFSALPDMAHYYDDPSGLVYDSRKELRVNVEHIIADNLERFPTELQSMNPYGLQNLVKGAIDSAVERVRRNYKTAIPQYYQGTIQLLLPLTLTDPAKADLALVAERFSGFYRAATCLTLDMAYNNARQVARPDRDWLVP